MAGLFTCFILVIMPSHNLSGKYHCTVNTSKHPESRWNRGGWRGKQLHGFFKAGFQITTRHRVTFVILTELLQKDKSCYSCAAREFKRGQRSKGAVCGYL